MCRVIGSSTGVKDNVVIDFDRALRRVNCGHVDSVAANVIDEIVVDMEIVQVRISRGMKLNAAASSVMNGVPAHPDVVHVI